MSRASVQRLGRHRPSTSTSKTESACSATETARSGPREVNRARLPRDLRRLIPFVLGLRSMLRPALAVPDRSARTRAAREKISRAPSLSLRRASASPRKRCASSDSGSMAAAASRGPRRPLREAREILVSWQYRQHREGSGMPARKAPTNEEGTSTCPARAVSWQALAGRFKALYSDVLDRAS